MRFCRYPYQAAAAVRPRTCSRTPVHYYETSYDTHVSDKSVHTVQYSDLRRGTRLSFFRPFRQGGAPEMKE